MKAGTLSFSVLVYTVCAILAITLIMIRRFLPAFGNSELGGPTGTILLACRNFETKHFFCSHKMDQLSILHQPVVLVHHIEHSTILWRHFQPLLNASQSTKFLNYFQCLFSDSVSFNQLDLLCILRSC